MKTYYVDETYRHTSTIEVEASSEEEAIRKVLQGKGIKLLDADHDYHYGINHIWKPNK